MTRKTITTAAALAALVAVAFAAGAPDALAQSGGGTMMGQPGQYQGGWHGHGGWLWGVHGILGAPLMLAGIAALVAPTRYLWRLGDKAGSS